MTEKVTDKRKGSCELGSTDVPIKGVKEGEKKLSVDLLRMGLVGKFDSKREVGGHDRKY